MLRKHSPDRSSHQPFDADALFILKLEKNINRLSLIMILCVEDRGFFFLASILILWIKDIIKQKIFEQV